MKFILLSLFFILSGAGFVAAQSYDSIQTGNIQQQIEGQMTPENPSASSEVTLKLTAYGTDLNSATISWSVNGTRIQSGVGMTEFKLTAGKNGEVKNVVASISPVGRPTVTKTFTVTPQEVTILYEAGSYTPPFYKGKSLFNKEGTVKFIAMPNLISSGGTRLSPSSLVYTWSIDGTVQGSMSGYGKNTITHTGSILGKSVFVEVEVSTPDKRTKGKGAFIISPQNPEALFYEKDPLYGTLFNYEISSNPFTLKESELTLEAVPYFTSASYPRASNLEYSWSINQAPIPVPQQQNYATFRNTTGQSGSAVISIIINNNSHLLQQAMRSASIKF